jgi:hypothetical protein
MSRGFISDGGPAETLARELKSAKLEWPKGLHSYFIPIDKIEDCVNNETVWEALKGIYPEMDDTTLSIYTSRICPAAQKVFTIFLCGAHGWCREAIRDILEENITDDDLPLARVYRDPRSEEYILGKRDHALCRLDDHTNCGLRVLSSWRLIEMQEDLCRDQWLALAPVFRSSQGSIPHHNLDDSVVLPYTDDQENKPELVMGGGYSEVWGVRVHPAHQDMLSSYDPKVRPRNKKWSEQLTSLRGL